MTRNLHGVVIGAGYFSHYHLDAWQRIPGVTITALADLDPNKAQAQADRFGIARAYADWRAMLETEQPDFVDIITPPATHGELCAAAATRGIHVVCQKPLAPTYAACQSIVQAMAATKVRFMVHENFRWQPWYREIKRLIDHDELGEIFSLSFRSRPGDGWGADAYLARQPFFRDYPRLLVYETGVHFIDTFRYLLGEIETVYARLRRLNPVIRGEDSGLLILGMAGGATAIWDANRFNESEAADPRYTFGELRIDGRNGHLVLDTDGRIFIKRLGRATEEHGYAPSRRGFGGDCVHRLQTHFVTQLRAGQPFESEGAEYLKTSKVVEACYASAAEDAVIRPAHWEPSTA